MNGEGGVPSNMKRGCFKCGAFGHGYNWCPQVRCECCGKTGHIARNCKNKLPPMERQTQRGPRELTKRNEHNVFLGELWERGESGKGVRETLLVNILCNGFQRELIVDTGADVTILYKQINGVEIEAVENRVITGVTGDQQNVIGIQ